MPKADHELSTGLISWAQATAHTLIDLAEQLEASAKEVPEVPVGLLRDTEFLVLACKDVFRAHQRIISTNNFERAKAAKGRAA